MKKLLFALALMLTLGLSSCFNKGEVLHSPEDFIKINGKIYRIMRVVPCEDCSPLWVMYAKGDSTTIDPQVLNENVINSVN